MIKVVIADDQDLIRGSLRIVLRQESDIEVIGLAGNGKEVIDLCQKEPPHIILMDINMPEMDGIEATRYIKEHFPDIHVIMLTTFHDMEYVKEAMKAGAVGYLLKAMQPEDLASSIRLVHRGETLIPQDIAKRMIFEWTGGTETTSTKSSSSEKKPSYGLTERELDVLRLMVTGKDNRQIANILYLAEGTVKNHISRIYSKLQVTDRVELILRVREEQVLD
ncbi:response regulator transcription factor [Bacillus sp. 31A1R]|uniref:Response regulator transcription factor n=1 Tax=Robertmurraya mangrovi TaxID=3098077 RepID=A0ABU5J1N8_9BACI|nr:response regulator transcription factor [Bacillus sp. 31A1R]MDZ5473282.1 response regulator transcription factor [Bacillus sp. 31A1R]